MVRIRHRISTFLTISALAFVGAVAAVTFGFSPAQAHTTTAPLLPNGQGTYTEWSGDEDGIDEADPVSCEGTDRVATGTAGNRESVLIDLAGVPDGAYITEVSVQSWHQGSGSTGGSYKSFVRINDEDRDAANNRVTTSTSGCTSAAQTINIGVTKSDNTVLEVGVLKVATNPNAVRIGALRATVTYDSGPSAPTLVSPADGATTSDTTPTFDWADDSVDPDVADSSDDFTYEIQVAPLVAEVCDWDHTTLGGLATTSEFTSNGQLGLGTYCWRVQTFDHNLFLTAGFGDHRTVTIAAKDEVTAEITADNKTYDGNANAGYTCDVVGEQSGDDVTCDGTHPGFFNSATVGTGKTVTATGLTLGGDDAGKYNLTNSSDTDTADINAAMLFVSANHQSKDYGEDDPTLTYTLTGFVNGETALTAAGFTGAGDCDREAGESVAGSPYLITCFPGTLAADNYTFQSGDTHNLTIDQATLSVDADDASKDFGDGDPAFTYTLSGFVNGEDEDSAGVTGQANCTRDAGETIAGSPYTITCATGNLGADNYTFQTGDTGDLTIEATDVTAEITAADKPYDGTTDAEYTCEVVGADPSDDVSCDGEPGIFDDASAGSGKTVTANGLALTGEDAGNYTLTNANDTDTADISKVPLDVDADDKAKDVGTDDPTFTYSLSGFVNGEDAMTAAGLTGSASCTRDPGESVSGSPYTITCTPGTLDADNYTFQSGDNGQLTINPDATVPTVTINQGSTQDDPTSTSPIVFDVVFSEPVTGFEDADVDLSGTAGATTAHVTGSGAEYEVAVSGMTGNGTVIAAVKAGAATDGTNDSTASSSTDHTVTFDGGDQTFTTGPTATISGSPTVGSTLTAGEGDPVPDQDSFEYQWYADGNEINGATNKTFKLTLDQVGKVITVKVTAIKAGYTDASDTSDPTAAVTGGSVPAPHGDLLVPVSDSTMAASCTFSVRGVVGNKVYTKFTTKAAEKKASAFATATVAKISMSCIAQPEGLPESAAFGTSFSNTGWTMYRTKYLQGPLAPSYQLCGDLKYTLKNGTEHTVENCSS